MERERHLSLMHNEIKVMEMNMFFEVQGAHSELKLSAFDKTRVEAVSHCVIFKYGVGRCCCRLLEPFYESIDRSCYQMFNYWLRCSWLDDLIDKFFNSCYTVSFITVELMKSIQKAIWLLGKSAWRCTVRVIGSIDLNFSFPLICWFEMELDEMLVNHWYYSN